MFTLGPRDLLIGLGSNSPNALEMLRRARALLRGEELFSLRRCSPLYRSEALLPPEAPVSWNLPFLNAVLLLETRTPRPSAEEIVGCLKQAELRLGREAAPRWAPRKIDLDLLAWSHPNYSSVVATVPHPELHRRPFALLPAQDCAQLANYSADASRWRYGPTGQVPLHTQPAEFAWPELVGILNVTPDSFSDGRADFSEALFETRVESMVREGATVIDVGAESTRPGAIPVLPQQEYERLAPWLALLVKLRKKLGFKISLDSRHPQTVARILEQHGLDWLNDVTGFENPQMLEIAARSGCQLVLMHSLAVPADSSRYLDTALDPIAQLLSWARARLTLLQSRGIDSTRVIFDPGIGFGKTARQNLAIVERASEFNALGVKLLLGHSRKRFLDPASSQAACERDLETAIVTARLANTGVDFLRVHCLASQARALRIGGRFC